MASPVIDVHTHCLTEAWFELLQQHGGPRYTVQGGARRPARDPSRRRAVHDAGAGDVRLRPAPEDDERARRRRRRRVAHLPELLLGRPGGEPAGRAHHERRHGGGADRASRTACAGSRRCRGSTRSAGARRARARVRRRRVRRDGARQHRRQAADRSAFAPIWAAIDAQALPVLVHPTAPPGVAEMDMVRFQLTASIGFTFDTSLAVARMIYDGFFDRYPRAQDHRVARRRRAAVPDRADGPVLRQHSRRAARRSRVRPSEYMPQIYADAVVFSPGRARRCASRCSAPTT